MSGGEESGNYGRVDTIICPTCRRRYSAIIIDDIASSCPYCNEKQRISLKIDETQPNSPKIDETSD